MRHIILISLMLAPFSAYAQMGTVHYTHTYAVLHSHYFVYRALTAEAFGSKPLSPETHATVSRSMVFGAAASLMYPTDKPHVEPEDRKVSGGVEYIDTTYVDFGGRTYTESRVIGAEIYLVSDELPAIPWRLENEERIYLGLRVMKATTEVDSAAVEAWFTPEIPIPAGPGLYGGLPGLILMVTNAASGEVYAADSLEMNMLFRAIEPPTRGRKASDRKYRRAKAAEIAEDRRVWEQSLRDIEEGKVQIIRRRGQ